ncbi:GMC family oxidoreductase [Nonomuraea monospora]|uniref:long-chain-alcohol oxidase n=1 Tax=Nonomuraea monospora TaxID=568818 RepID=A0ABN3D2G9_9ACTN
MPALDGTCRATLTALCDTFFPAAPHADDPDPFWSRTASSFGVDAAVAQLLDALPDDQRNALAGLVDAFTATGFASLPVTAREEAVAAVAQSSSQAAGGVAALRRMTYLLAYSLVDADNRNPNWPALGYPGPLSPPPRKRPSALITEPAGDRIDLEADVVVVGSGAGGSVVAAELAQHGARVVVLEANAHHDEADFDQTELHAYNNLFWRGGPQPTADANVTLLAGSTVGGGTVINWADCLHTPAAVRQEWADRFGLKDLTSQSFDAHLDAVWTRLSVNDRNSDYNTPHQLIAEAATALGWHFDRVFRNSDQSTYDMTSVGYIGFGDQTGSKQSTMLTYLPDAVAAGATVIARCTVDRVLVENGSARGVQGTYRSSDGHVLPVTVEAPHVVVAAGALESPALLLRSGIGGPAAGQHLRIHPSLVTVGIHDRDTEPWIGAPQALVMDNFADGPDGYGFLIELIQFMPGLIAAALPADSGAAHKQEMSELRRGVPLVTLVRDHGGGRVTIGDDGAAVVEYTLTDPVDVRNTREAIRAMVQLHVASGARRIIPFATGAPQWHAGDDVDSYVESLTAIPLAAGGWGITSAHQMGTCRMGDDPATSVANPRGELHDVRGVWIGDASAFPTPSGVNPMITIMALARRTAAHLRESLGYAAT